MELKAGRELDALVAEKIMGWSVVEVPKRFGIVERHLVAPGEPHEQNTVAEYINGHTVAPCLPSHFLPHYSTSIGDAWLVVEKLKDTYYDFSLEQDQGEYLEWKASFGGASWEWKTPPGAICLAALEAIKDAHD